MTGGRYEGDAVLCPRWLLWSFEGWGDGPGPGEVEKIGTAMGYLGRAAIGGQAWEKQVEARVEIPSGEGSPERDLVTDRVASGGSFQYLLLGGVPTPVTPTLQWARYPDLENMGLRGAAQACISWLLKLS